MDQDRYRQIFEQKALMSGGSRLGGAYEGAGYIRTCKDPYKIGNAEGKTPGRCKKYQKHNAWLEYVAIAKADPRNAHMTHQQLLNFLGKNGPNYQHYEMWKAQRRAAKPKKKTMKGALPK